MHFKNFIYDKKSKELSHRISITERSQLWRQNINQKIIQANISFQLRIKLQI